MQRQSAGIRHDALLIMYTLVTSTLPFILSPFFTLFSLALSPCLIHPFPTLVTTLAERAACVYVRLVLTKTIFGCNKSRYLHRFLSMFTRYMYFLHGLFVCVLILASIYPCMYYFLCIFNDGKKNV